MTEEILSPFLFSFYETLPRQGPGNDQLTRSIIAELSDLPKRPKIIDMGCGTGSQTRILAERGDVTAVDFYQPFLNILMKTAAEQNLSDRITPLCSSMDSLPIETEPVDLIWSEGAIYIIGFKQGLVSWRSLVKPGGYMVVSELTRLSDNPHKDAFDFWNKEYPAVKSVTKNCQTIEVSGYRCLKTIKLPSSAWDDFYAPQIKKIQNLRSTSLSAQEENFLQEIEREIRIMKQYANDYGYIFYIMQRPFP